MSESRPRLLSREKGLADPRTEAMLSHRIEQLGRQRDGWQNWLERMTGQRAESAEVEPPDVTPPPTRQPERWRREGLVQ